MHFPVVLLFIPCAFAYYSVCLHCNTVRRLRIVVFMLLFVCLFVIGRGYTELRRGVPDSAMQDPEYARGSYLMAMQTETGEWIYRLGGLVRSMIRMTLASNCLHNPADIPVLEGRGRFITLQRIVTCKCFAVRHLSDHSRGHCSLSWRFLLYMRASHWNSAFALLAAVRLLPRWPCISLADGNLHRGGIRSHCTLGRGFADCELSSTFGVGLEAFPNFWVRPYSS